MFILQTRITYRIQSFASMADAIHAGMALGVPFDVSAPTGAILWVWEQRP